MDRISNLRILGVCLAFAVSLSSAAAPRNVKQYTIEEFLDTTSISGASFAPDGSKILVSSNETGIFNAFALPVSGGDPVQLTHSTADSIFARSYFPNDERFIYTADEGGNELTHVYVRELDGAAVDITPGENLKANFLDWAKDDRSFFITSNERDARYFDLYEVATDGYEKTLLLENTSGYNMADVSPDKRYIALSKVITRTNSEVMIHDRQTGETRKLMEGEEEAVCRPQGFTADGKQLHCLTDRGHEFLYLVREDFETDTQEVIEKLEWDVSYARLSKKGKYLVVGINRDGRSEVRLYDMADGAPVALPEVPGADIASVSLSQDDTAMAFYVQGGATPGDLYYQKLGASGKPLRLTHRLNPSIDPRDLVNPEVVRFKSFDGVSVPGILYKPHQAVATAKAPALVFVHGGPGGQTRATYSATIQYLVNHGYVIFGINNRGSSGYGKTFFAMDDLKHSEGDLDDCVSSKQMLIDTGYVDPDRIGIMGGSYGGYMVCAALAFRPQAFEVGVNIFGVTNWVRTLKSIPSWWESTRNSLYKELGDPFTQEDYLRKISPLFHAKNIVKPMIVLQGANDARVLQVESDELVAAVRANGVSVEYVVFPDEGHGFRKNKNVIAGYEKVLAFLDKRLKGGH